MEMNDYYSTLAMTTVMNNKDDFECLIKAIKEISQGKKKSH